MLSSLPSHTHHIYKLNPKIKTHQIIKNHKKIINLIPHTMLYSKFSLSSQDVNKEEPIKLFSPENPTPIETIFLSNIDQAVAFPVETLYFFEAPQNKGPSSTLDVIEVVKKAVTEVLLVPYYFMAGRLNFNTETNRFELLCNNSGVLFVGSNSTIALKELGDLFLPNETFHHLVHRVPIYSSLAETAIFTVQVTRFKCGGFSLGIVTNHAILDGRSASEMLHNLASICRGDGLILNVLNNDRTLLRSRTPPQIKYPHNEYIKIPKDTTFGTIFTSQDQKAPSPLVFLPKYVHKIFSFTPQMLNSLKEKAQIKCSTFEAIVAHLWRARTRAIFDDLDEISTVLFAVDIRAKMSPPLPNGFVGNAVVTAFSSAKVGDLMEKSFGFCVEKVKEGRDRVTEDYVKSVVDWLEVYKGVPSTCNGKNFYVSAWWKLNFGDLDFGYGKAVFGGPVASGNDEFVVLLNNEKIGGGINVLIGLEKDKMNRFMNCVFEI